jgi:hypothetical protein
MLELIMVGEGIFDKGKVGVSEGDVVGRTVLCLDVD